MSFLFFCNNFGLGKNKILEFVDSKSAQNFNLETFFSEWPPSKV